MEGRKGSGCSLGVTGCCCTKFYCEDREQKKTEWKDSTDSEPEKQEKPYLRQESEMELKRLAQIKRNFVYRAGEVGERYSGRVETAEAVPPHSSPETCKGTSVS